jgi:hypothetical protein
MKSHELYFYLDMMGKISLDGFSKEVTAVLSDGTGTYSAPRFKIALRSSKRHLLLRFMKINELGGQILKEPTQIKNQNSFQMILGDKDSRLVLKNIHIPFTYTSDEAIELSHKLRVADQILRNEDLLLGIQSPDQPIMSVDYQPNYKDYTWLTQQIEILISQFPLEFHVGALKRYENEPDQTKYKIPENALCRCLIIKRASEGRDRGVSPAFVSMDPLPLDFNTIEGKWEFRH